MAERFVSSRACVECSCARALTYKKLHPEKMNAQRRAWVHRNLEKSRATKAAWNRAHPEGQAKRARKWFLANREKANAATNEWRKRNPGKACARQNKRRTAKMKRTPLWADLEAIAVFYTEAAQRRAAGEMVEVDHVIPLQGEAVSGLHVPGNLQILAMSANRAKANIFLEN